MWTKLSRRRLLMALAGMAALALVTASIGYLVLLADLPALDDLHGYAAAPSSKIYDRHGTLLFEMPPPHSGRHSPVPLDEIPQALQDAIIATEDASYYQNPGVDGWAIVRALWINIQGGEILSGGSTITQQLARNLLLSPEERYERTLKRKMREAILAWRLARNYSKDQILELYLNEIYFGNMAYGVEAASQAYFGKPVRDLDLAECTLLAGLPQAPFHYNPLEHLDKAKARQQVVLGLMVKNGYLTPEKARQAQEEKLYFAASEYEIRAPHFVMHVRGQLEQELGLERLEQGGLEIYTTLDLDLNETTRNIMRQRLVRLAECNGQQQDCPPGGHNVRNAAVVALDPHTGEILTMVGSPDYFSARIDGAVNGTTALRQPGSSIKPITYAAAFARGDLTPATMMLDVRTSFLTREGASYVPLNYDLQFRGPVRLREALGSSYNVIAVKVLDAIGIETMVDLARQMGISTFADKDRLGLAVTLGGGEVRLLELATAYASLANGGYAIEPVAILRVEDHQGQVLLSHALAANDQAPGRRVLDERVAYLVTDILSDEMARIPSFGEGSALDLTRPAAVKTGTTTDFRDNWTVGYTAGDPQGSIHGLVVGVWAGNADNEAMKDISGITGAAPIWHDVMETAHKGQPAHDFSQPDGLVHVEVCALSGLLPGPDCPHRVNEWFIAGTEPTRVDDMHQRIALDRATGLRASKDTPQERVVYRVYTILPPEAREWGREEGIAEPPPALEDQDENQQSVALCGNEGSPGLVLVSPDDGAAYQLDPTLPRGSQRIVVSARGQDDTSLSHVTLLVDGQPLAQFSAPPYKALWLLEAGRHVFRAEGQTTAGQRVTSQDVWLDIIE